MKKIAKRQQPKRSRSITGDRLEDLLASLYIDQLRALASNLGLTGSRKTKEDLVEAISTSGRSLAEIAELAYKFESGSPYSHSFICGFRGGNFKKVAAKKAYKTPGYPALKELELVYIADADDAYVVTLEHKVQTKEWKYDEEADVKRRVSNTLRHPIVCSFLKGQGVFLANYPGFSQGLATKRSERLEYESIITQALNIFSDILGITFASIAFRPALDELSSLESPRLKIIRANPSTTSGSAMMSVDNSGESIADWLSTNLLRYAPGLDPANLKIGIRGFIKELAQNDWVVFWSQEKVATRIRFWGTGTEMLFVWKGTDKNFFPLRQILSLVVPVAKKSGSSSIDQAWKIITSKSAGDLTQPSDLSSQVNMDLDELQHTIKMALKAGIVEPIYRLRAEQLVLECANDWTTKLSQLNQVYKLEDGTELDGGDPANIEIAFRRKSHEGAK